MAKPGRPPGGARPHVIFVRLSDEDEARIQELAKVWGPVAALNRSQVVIEAIRRAHSQALDGRNGQPPKKKTKNPPSNA